MKTIFVLLLPILILSCSNFERGFLTRVFNDGHEAWIFVVYPSTKNKAVGDGGKRANTSAAATVTCARSIRQLMSGNFVTDGRVWIVFLFSCRALCSRHR
ncbi:hypothetical protein L596_000341 [Steinernema carpocapsae]|uniref:Uncharacterized protein n=1 Tax=Steinernema carpocapsae TaxID=34508 RepID=A0A4V6I724_STECR|nr:hypothetical protein L596_000341 [Steinernema carpocapsae]